MSGAQRTSIMQLKPTSVSVRLPNGEVKSHENNIVIMADFGMWIKGEDTLELFPWERVLHVFLDNVEEQSKVWEEVVLTAFEDIFDYEDDEEDVTEEVDNTDKGVDANPEVSSDSTENTTSNSSGDNPNVNPYK